MDTRTSLKDLVDPKKNIKQRRNRQVIVMLNDDEYNELLEKSKQASIGLSPYIRMKMLDKSKG